MSIDKISNGPQNVPVQNSPDKTRTGENEADIKSVDNDTYQFTAITENLKQALRSADTVINTKRVEQVKAELLTGTYQFDAEQIAKKMIDLERTLPDTG